MEFFNSDGLVTENGRVRFSGFGSGIDFQSAVEGIMEARRAPVDRLETRIADNTAQIDAFNALQSRLAVLEETAAKLRGAVSFDSAKDIFKAKEAFASSSRTDGQVASSATSILTANISNNAQATSHNVEVLRTAAAHKTASDAFADSTSSLGFTGDFTINGQTISVSSSDSLLDVRDRINAANSGDDATGVTASAVSVSATKNVLVLTADKVGETIALSETSGSPLQDLGIFANAAGDLKNEQQAAATSVFRADGLSDGSVLESNLSVSDASAVLSSHSGISSDSGTLEFTLTNGPAAVTRSVAFDTDSDSLNDLADRIDATEGLSARVVTSNGVSSLEVNAENLQNLQRSDFVSDSTAALDTVGATSGQSAQLTLIDHGLDGAAPTSATTAVIDTSTDDLTAVRDAINATGVASASIETVNGQDRLNIQSASGGKLTITDDQGTLAEDLGIETVDAVSELSVVDTDTTTADVVSELGIQTADAISRKTNTVDDLFQGITLNLLTAERGTSVKLDVENDEDAVRAAVDDFVTAYNSVKQYINAQRQDVALEDQAENTIGALRNDPLLSEVESRLNRVLAFGAENVSGTIETLGQIGVDFVNNSSLSDPTLKDTLTIDDAELNDSLLNNFGEVRDLFRFNFTANSSNVTMLNFSGDTTPSDTDYTLNVQKDANGKIISADINGVAGSVDINGDTLTATDATGANGLALLYTGPDSTTESIDFNVSTGVASQMFFAADRLGDQTDGLVEAEIDRLTERNDDFQTRIDSLERRLEAQRQDLISRFVRMEEALVELENARQRLDELAQTLNPERN